MSDLLIQHANVLQIAPDSSAPSASILQDHDIIVRGNRIDAIQPTGSDPSQFKQVIDARGMLAMPGLINTHAHVPMVIFRGLAEDVNIDAWFNDFIWPIESNLTADDVYWGTLLGTAEMIEGGVTTTADHYFHMERSAQAVEKIGSRALLGWAIFGSQGQAMIDRTESFVREYQDAAHGRIHTLMAPHAPYTCDDDFLRACVQAAERQGVGIHIHVAETPQQTTTSLAARGITPIQVLEQTGVLEVPTILAHVLGATPSDIEIMASERTGVAHAPKTYMKLAMGRAPVLEFRKAGIPVGLATDGAMSNNTMDLWEALRLMPMIQKMGTGVAENMPIPEALYVATRGSAQVLGMGDQIGSLEEGYLADIILVDLNGLHHQPLHSPTTSLVYNTRPSDVQTVICDGQVIMRDRQILTVDTQEIVGYVKAHMERLSQRVPAQRIQSYQT